MQEKVLSPGVQDRDEADLGSKVFRVCGDLVQCCCGTPEQQVIENPLVIKAQAIQHVRKREDNMEVRDRKEFAFAGC
jgi:hypothetical protein